MKHGNAVTDRIKAIELFSSCTPDELSLISSNVTTHSASAGDLLAGEGRSGHEFMVIVSGSAKVSVGELEVATLGPGDFFGEVAILDNGPRTATVVATSDLVAEVSSHHEFQAILLGAPSVAHRILVRLAHRLREADIHLAS